MDHCPLIRLINQRPTGETLQSRIYYYYNFQILYYINSKSIKEHDDLDDSDSTVDRARKENYIKNVEIQSDKIILHHSKLDPCIISLKIIYSLLN